tara:strand:- start:440 stop:601 length:162 start_codon:yes stop_codon:yes gene_type:complete
MGAQSAKLLDQVTGSKVSTELQYVLMARIKSSHRRKAAEKFNISNLTAGITVY